VASNREPPAGVTEGTGSDAEAEVLSMFHATADHQAQAAPSQAGQPQPPPLRVTREQKPEVPPAPSIAEKVGHTPDAADTPPPAVTGERALLKEEVASNREPPTGVTEGTGSDAKAEVLSLLHASGDYQAQAVPAQVEQPHPASQQIVQDRRSAVPPAPSNGEELGHSVIAADTPTTKPGDTAVLSAPEGVGRTAGAAKTPAPTQPEATAGLSVALEARRTADATKAPAPTVTEGTMSEAEAEVLAILHVPSDKLAQAVPPQPGQAQAAPPQDESKQPASPQTAQQQQPSPAQTAQKRTPEEVPTPGSMYDFESRPIGSLTVKTSYRAGDVPADLGREKLTHMQAKASDDVLVRDWPLTCYRWEAPALCHRPLYFEEVNLERFGYGPRYLRIAQPVISAGQFFATVPILPYKMFSEPARQCAYTLGQYRPGSPVPYYVEFPAWSWSGAGVESVLVTGLIFAIP